MSDSNLTERCLKLLAEGKKIAAIAALKEELGLGLAEAVDRVEAEFAKHAGAREAKLVAAGLTGVVLVSILDGLQLASGGFVPGAQQFEIFCRVFEDWTLGAELKEARLEAFYEYLYGVSWRRGNEDGSSYLPVKTTSRVIAGEERASKPWGAALSSEMVQFWFCHAKKDGSLERVDKAMF